MDKNASDFYVTCATVIPVLFLAVAVQGGAYKSVLKTYVRIDMYSRNTIRGLLTGQPITSTRWQRRRESLAGYTAPLVWAIALLIPAAGGVGEGLAIYVLYKESEPAGVRLWVLVATLALVAAVIAGPLLVWLRSADRSDDPVNQKMKQWLEKLEAEDDLAKAVEALERESTEATSGPGSDEQARARVERLVQRAHEAADRLHKLSE